LRGIRISLRGLILGGLFALAPMAQAHEPLEPAEAETILERIVASRAVAREGAPADRAEALYALGENVARVTAELNRDLLAHGGDLGLATSVLAGELNRRGIHLSYSAPAKRYKAYLPPYEDYLAVAPEGPRAADAGFHILAGRFYDSFVADPFRLIDLDWPGLTDQISRAEELLARYPAHEDREEILFILGVDCVRAARLAPDDATAKTYAGRARAVLTALQDAYPDGLRAITARTLLKSLPADD
jgi:hypothetical protein